MVIGFATEFRAGNEVYHFNKERLEIRKDIVNSVQVVISSSDTDMLHDEPVCNVSVTYTLKYTSGTWREGTIFKSLADCKTAILQSFKIIE